MKTALLVIATGPNYYQYVNPLIESAKQNFVKHEVILWTDSRALAYQVKAPYVILKEGLGYPGETLNRYATFIKEKPLLEKFDQLFYVDIDMRFVAPVGEEVFSDGITATLHPGFVGEYGTPERRRESVAFISPLFRNEYYCGGFNGGDAKTFIQMAEGLACNIKFDTEHGITAVWHDESHLNWWLYHNPPAKILDPSYCYPENAGPHYLNKWAAAGINPTPKILALTKSGR
jgi:hypothetical protein